MANVIAAAELSTMKAEHEKLHQRLSQAEDDARRAKEEAKRELGL